METIDLHYGYAQADITPAYPIKLIGFNREDNLSQGILHPLITQCSLFRTPSDVYALIAIDSIGFDSKKSLELRQKSAHILNTSIENIMLFFSHTHSAPDADSDEKYFSMICKKVQECIKNAEINSVKAKIGWGVSKTDIGVNRRGANETLDTRLGILKIMDYRTDKPLGMILKATAHANVLSSDNYKISSDYYHKTREILESNYHCPVMITQGASGNVRPKYQHSHGIMAEVDPSSLKNLAPELLEQLNKESLEALEKMALEINKSIELVFDKIETNEVYNIQMFSQNKIFESPVPDANHAKSIVLEAKENAGIDGTNWYKEVLKLHKQGITTQYSEMEIAYFILNEGCFCGVSDEIMCESALSVSGQLNNDLVFLSGYTNGCTGGYLPTAQEHDKGGYEVLWSYLLFYPYCGRVMAFNRNTAEILESTVLNTLRQNLY